MKRSSMHMIEADWFSIEILHNDAVFGRVAMGERRSDDALAAPEVERYIETNCVRGQWAYMMSARNGQPLPSTAPLRAQRVKQLVHVFYFKDKKDAALFRLAFG